MYQVYSDTEKPSPTGSARTVSTSPPLNVRVAARRLQAIHGDALDFGVGGLRRNAVS